MNILLFILIGLIAGALAGIDLLATFAERAHTLDFSMP